MPVQRIPNRIRETRQFARDSGGLIITACQLPVPFSELLDSCLANSIQGPNPVAVCLLDGPDFLIPPHEWLTSAPLGVLAVFDAYGEDVGALGLNDPFIRPAVDLPLFINWLTFLGHVAPSPLDLVFSRRLYAAVHCLAMEPEIRNDQAVRIASSLCIKLDRPDLAQTLTSHVSCRHGLNNLERDRFADFAFGLAG